MANYKRTMTKGVELDAVLKLANEWTVEERNLFEKIRNATHQSYGCASGDVYIGLADVLAGLYEDEELRHEQAALAMEVNNG